MMQCYKYIHKGKSTKNNGGFHDKGNKLRISLKSAKLNKRLVEICHTVTSNIYYCRLARWARLESISKSTQFTKCNY